MNYKKDPKNLRISIDSSDEKNPKAVVFKNTIYAADFSEKYSIIRDVVNSTVDNSRTTTDH